MSKAAFKSFFHHPDISLPVLSRGICTELLEILDILGDCLSQGAWTMLCRTCYPRGTSYRNAVYRLRKKGLVVYRCSAGQAPIIAITGKGEGFLDIWHRPTRFWNEKWNGIWYVLVYDVPERQRKYRDAIRIFLRRMRMGQLQRSVWISPRDIRPEYDDLNQAGGFNDYAFLFESRTVLGRRNEDVVLKAWNFDELEARQQWYLETGRKHLGRITAGACNSGTLLKLAREELSAYAAVMAEDPLLPEELWPKGYSGKQVYDLHRRISKEIGRRVGAWKLK